MKFASAHLHKLRVVRIKRHTIAHRETPPATVTRQTTVSGVPVLPGPVHPVRFKVSIKVERATFNVRHTDALLAPASKAARTCSTFSASIVGGLPPLRPRRRAAARPALTGIDRLGDQHSLVFGKRAEQVEQKRAVRIRGVDRVRQRSKGDTTFLQILDDADQVGE